MPDFLTFPYLASIMIILFSFMSHESVWNALFKVNLIILAFKTQISWPYFQIWYLKRILLDIPIWPCTFCNKHFIQIRIFSSTNWMTHWIQGRYLYCLTKHLTKKNLSLLLEIIWYSVWFSNMKKKTLNKKE